MWKKCIGNGTDRPERITVNDNEVYIRRNIVFVEVESEEDEESASRYEWEELVISKDIWVVCSKFLGYDQALDDVYAALTELADIIAEG